MTITVQLLSATHLHELARRAGELQEESQQARNADENSQRQMAEDNRFYEITSSIVMRALEAAGSAEFALQAMRLERSDYKMSEHPRIESPNIWGIPVPSRLSEGDLCGVGLRVWQWCKDSGLNPELKWAGTTAAEAFERSSLELPQHANLGHVVGVGVSQKTQYWAIKIRW